ncbi:MAG: WYL domain-containing transcriptional regulator [Deltaproteobacteria bacterium]|nr:WYL domain-containing transcriptional regulator [Deltaproteobacteria bacterium]
MGRPGKIDRQDGGGAPYAPAIRLAGVRALLDSATGASVYDIAERFGVSIRTGLRYLEALRAAGEPLFEETLLKRKVWRLMPSARRETLSLTTSQMLSLFLSRRVFDFLAGTGFKEDLDDVFKRLEATLRRRDFVAARHLDRKIFDINEAPHIYEGRIEHVNEILTALLREDRLEIAHESVRAGARGSLFEPYTLLVYKKGLYLAGLSHVHGQIRTLALDGFRDVTWRRGDRFVYPPDFHPDKLAEGAFGLIKGAPVRARVFFTDKVARYVRRRLWHPTQRFRRVAGGIELRVDLKGTVEFQSWILSFGDQATVQSPPELRDAVREEVRRALANYGPPRPRTRTRTRP